MTWPWNGDEYSAKLDLPRNKEENLREGVGGEGLRVSWIWISNTVVSHFEE